MRKESIAVALACMIAILPASAASSLPAQVRLPAGEEIVSSGAEVLGDYPAQHAWLQLAVTGKPRGTPATPSDVQSAADGLVRNGIARDRIQSTIVVPSKEVQRVTAQRIGLLLVTLDPPTQENLAKTLAAADSSGQSGMLFPIRIITSRDSCANKDRDGRKAGRGAYTRAGELARILGLRVENTYVTERRSAPQREAVEAICGSDRPSVPSDVHLIFPAGLSPSYAIRTSATSILSVTGKPELKESAGDSHWVESSASMPDVSAGSGVNVPLHVNVIVPPDEPFVSGIGAFRATVPDDEALLIVTPYPLASAQQLESIQKMLLGAGFSARDIMLEEQHLVVKLDSPSDTTLSAIDRAIAPVRNAQIKDVRYEIVPFSLRCARVQAAILRAAVRQSLARARAMASAAGLKVGSFIGVMDGGSYESTICIHDAHAGVPAMLAASKTFNPIDVKLWGAHTTDAQFARVVDAAWQLEETPPAIARAQRYAGKREPYFARQQHFVSSLGGVVASADVPLSKQSSNAKCAAEGLSALRVATMSGLAEIRPYKPRAIIDAAEQFLVEKGACSLSAGRYATASPPWLAPNPSQAFPTRPTVREHVFIVP